jgi:ABC-type nitrate/sulfonate/bicarbonate transport system substrate-binding protein
MASMRLVVPDLISNSYFPLLAAADLGFFADEGLDISVDLLFPVNDAYKALRDGSVEFVGGSAHSALAAFPEWEGVQLLGAQAQGMYWFLVMRADLGLERGQLDGIRGRTIGAAPWVEMGLRRLLQEAGYDLKRDDIRIVGIPGSASPSVNFGLNAAQALADGKIDGFWANGMGTEVAVRSGSGTVVLDVRRGDGPKAAFFYTFSALATTRKLMERQPEIAKAAVRAMVKTQNALRRKPALATKVGKKRFPKEQAALIAELIRRDGPYLQSMISREAVSGMNRFALDIGILSKDVPYERIVAAEVQTLWSAIDP